MTAMADLESYLYITRDFDNTTQEPLTSGIAQFKEKNELEIAQYLDLKLKKTAQQASNVPSSATTSATERVKRHLFSSPADKAWIPLMQSTPADVPSKAQPKDILKSKLSKLAQSVENADDESSSSSDDESTHDASYDTPSKPLNRRHMSPSEKTELEELRKLRSFVISLSRGNSIIEGAKIGVANVKVITDDEAQQLERRAQDLTREVERLNKLVEELREDAATVRRTNVSLKEILELKDKSIDDSKTTMKEFEKTIQDVKRDSEDSLSRLVGEKGDQITPQKFPELSSVYDELELSLVDNLTLTQTQNLIKNLLLNLNIPFNRVKTQVPHIVKRLEHEGTLAEFASRTHLLLYGQEMDIGKYLQEHNDHKLQQCTTQMFKNIELVYAVLNE